MTFSSGSWLATLAGWHQASKMLKLSLLRLILAVSGTSSRNAQNNAPEARSDHVWHQATEILKISFPVAHSGNIWRQAARFMSLDLQLHGVRHIKLQILEDLCV